MDCMFGYRVALRNVWVECDSLVNISWSMYNQGHRYVCGKKDRGGLLRLN